MDMNYLLSLHQRALIQASASPLASDQHTHLTRAGFYASLIAAQQRRTGAQSSLAL